MTDKVNGNEHETPPPPHKVAGYPYVQLSGEEQSECLVLSCAPMIDETIEGILKVVNEVLEKYRELDAQCHATMFIPALKFVEVILMNHHVAQKVEAGSPSPQDFIELLKKLGERDGGSPSN